MAELVPVSQSKVSSSVVVVPVLGLGVLVGVGVVEVVSSVDVP